MDSVNGSGLGEPVFGQGSNSHRDPGTGPVSLADVGWMEARQFQTCNCLFHATTGRRVETGFSLRVRVSGEW